MNAGMDGSGTPKLAHTQAGQTHYIVSVAAVDDMEELGQLLSEARKRFGMPERAEFRGHDSSDKMQQAVLEAGEAVGLCVGALIIDKTATCQRHEGIALPSAAEFQTIVGIELLERFLTRYCLAGLWRDEDTRSKKRQQDFATAVKRIHRTHWPGTHLNVRHRKSHSVDLIQLADIVGYGLSRLIRGVEMESELRRCLQAIRKDERNLILGPMAWEPKEEY